MNSQTSQFLTRVYQLPIIGDLLCFTGHAFFMSSAPLVFQLSAYRRMEFGTSVIWAPESRKQSILNGIECLQGHDTEMFLRFTKRQRLFLYYSHNRKATNWFGYVFGLHQRYVELGAEGVAYFIVQSLLISDASPSVNQCRLSDLQRAAVKAVPRRTMEWMQQHAFDPRLINSYSKVVEKWEQTH